MSDELTKLPKPRAAIAYFPQGRTEPISVTHASRTHVQGIRCVDGIPVTLRLREPTEAEVIKIRVAALGRGFAVEE